MPLTALTPTVSWVMIPVFGFVSRSTRRLTGNVWIEFGAGCTTADSAAKKQHVVPAPGAPSVRDDDEP